MEVQLLGIEFLPNDVFHKLVFRDMRTKLNSKAFLLLWLRISWLGLIALASKRLHLSGHFSSLKGKFLRSQRSRCILPPTAVGSCCSPHVCEKWRPAP